MRKLIIFFLTASLFIACNNDKKADRRPDRETDDYRSDDKDSRDRDSKDADYKDSDEKDKTDDVKSSGNWSSSDVRLFVDNCVSEAVKGGMQKQKATDYCECMQRKLEVLYPDSQDVGNLDVESPSIKDMINKCLGL